MDVPVSDSMSLSPNISFFPLTALTDNIGTPGIGLDIKEGKTMLQRMFHLVMLFLPCMQEFGKGG